MRLAGFRVRGRIGTPEAHPHALWLLAWVEDLLEGRTLDAVRQSPPWPSPSDPVLCATLQQSLFDAGWCLVDWASGAVTVAAELASAWSESGRDGLARRLFDVAEKDAEWWVDATTGVLLSDATRDQFDWDGRLRADVVIDPEVAGEEVLAGALLDVRDLLRKSMVDVTGQSFLAAPLEAGDRADIVFTLWGDPRRRVMPDHLSDLEPGLRAARPDLFGTSERAETRVVRLPRRPVEALARCVEGLPAAVRLPSRDLASRHAGHVCGLVEHRRQDLVNWLSQAFDVRPVAGPTAVHFSALREICASTPSGGVVAIATAFLNPALAADPEGLARCLLAAKDDVRIVLIYGHADDLSVAEQRVDIDQFRAALESVAPTVRPRLNVVAGACRSHEKVVVGSGGDWMIGSWNAGSSRLGADLFEVGLVGRAPAFAADVARRLRENVEEPAAVGAMDRLVELLDAAPDRPFVEAEAAWERLRDAAVALRTVASVACSAPEIWDRAVAALRVAVQPFRRAASLTLVDELQTRDVLAQHLQVATREVLITSDRLTDEGLDASTLRSLRRCDAVRVIWGREHPEDGPRGSANREQWRRGRVAVRAGKEILGRRFASSERPMQNHAKFLVVDGLHGLVTSENLLSYGGEKGERESRELGVSFACPVIARALDAAAAAWQLGVYDEAGGALDQVERACSWSGNEAWHAMANFEADLLSGWDAAGVLQAVVEQTSYPDERRSAAWRDGLESMRQACGPRFFTRVADRAERLGLARVEGEVWTPWDALPWSEGGERDALVRADQMRVAAMPAPPDRREAPVALGARRGMDEALGVIESTLVRIEAGRFRMGDRRVPGEGPQHVVELTLPFDLASVPVTQGLWLAVMGSCPTMPSSCVGDKCPVVNVSMRDIRAFLAKLNAADGGGEFDLPTEAQWEYACRAGSPTIYCFGDDPGRGDAPGLLERFAWTKRNANGRSQPVGRLQPNAWDLYDMHGLVYEATRDGKRTYTAQEATDPLGSDSGGVARGGCWGRSPVQRDAAEEHFRSAARQVFEQSKRVGFRLMRRVGG